MGKLVVKTGVESFTTVDKLGVFIDDVIGDKVYIKISKPGFQHILILHEYEFKKLFEQYAIVKKLEIGEMKKAFSVTCIRVRTYKENEVVKDEG